MDPGSINYARTAMLRRESATQLHAHNYPYIAPPHCPSAAPTHSHSPPRGTCPSFFTMSDFGSNMPPLNTRTYTQTPHAACEQHFDEFGGVPHGGGVGSSARVHSHK